MVENVIIIKLREIDGIIYASTLDVARDFNKRHADVLRAIEELRESLNEVLRSVWFREATYFDPTQRKLRCYEMTRQGFSLLVMSFTGKEALEWKVAYILKFDEMEGKLGAGAKSERLWDRGKPSGEIIAFHGPRAPQGELFDSEPRDSSFFKAITGMAGPFYGYERDSIRDIESEVPQPNGVFKPELETVEKWNYESREVAQVEHKGLAHDYMLRRDPAGDPWILWIGAARGVYDERVKQPWLVYNDKRVFLRISSTTPCEVIELVLHQVPGLASPLNLATIREYFEDANPSE